MKKAEENTSNKEEKTKKPEENTSNKDKKTKKTEQNTSNKEEKAKKTEQKRTAKNSILEISEEAKDNLNLQSKKYQNKDEKALLTAEDAEMSHEKLQKIKDEIKESRKESKDKVKNSSLRKKLVRNLVITILVTIYFLFIDLGINSIPITAYILDLKTFSVFIAIISIVIFERAYKKDENYLAIHGIEMVVVGIETLLLLQLYSVGNEYFNYILLGITLGMIVYYLLKCLCIYVRYKTKGK